MEVTNIQKSDCQVLSRDAIKYIAMFTMLLNHIAHVLLPRGTLLYVILEDIGYFTAPAMCFFLVEGYHYTRSKWKYGRRLFLFALLSQGPYYLAFHYGNLNMFFTLFCCFLILVVLERVERLWLQKILCILLLFVTVFSDWALIAPLLTILLARNWEDQRKMWASYVGIALFFVVLNLQSSMAISRVDGREASLTAQAVCQAFCAGLGILAAAAAVLIFYNGERAKKGQTISKWFFYFFYPTHLMILYLIKMVYIT